MTIRQAAKVSAIVLTLAAISAGLLAINLFNIAYILTNARNL